MVRDNYGLQCLVCDLAESKKALGIIESSQEEKAASAKTAMLFSNKYSSFFTNVTVDGSCAKSLLI